MFCNLIDMFDYAHYFDNDNANLVKIAVKYTSKLYPIYVLVQYHSGRELTKEQKDYLDLLSELVDKYNVDVTLVMNEQDKSRYTEYDKDNNFKFLMHSSYDLPNELTNNQAKIRNYIFKSASSRFGNKNIDWIFMLDEGVLLNGSYDADLFILSLVTWQYYATKHSIQFIADENKIGLSGISNDKLDDKVVIDQNIPIQSAFLINLAECNRRHIEFETMIDIAEDIDFNISILANGLHIAVLSNDLLKLEQTIPDCRSTRKLNNLQINLWAKWGDKIVKQFSVENNNLKVKLLSNCSSIIEEYNASNKHRMTWPKNEQMYAEYLAQKKRLLN